MLQVNIIVLFPALLKPNGLKDTIVKLGQKKALSILFIIQYLKLLA